MSAYSKDTLAALLKGLDHSQGLVMLVNRDGKIIYVNQTLMTVTGYSRNELIGQTPQVFNSHEHDESFYQNLWQTILRGNSFTANFINRKKNGETFLEHQSISPICQDDDEITHYIAIGQVISEASGQQSDHDAFIFYDQLTGLPNRHYFERNIKEALKHAQRSQTQMAVFMIDLDHFKNINDTLGHAVGDDVLRLTGKRLSNCVRSSDVCVRLGGDEFAIIVNDVEQTSMLSMLASDIVEKISAPLDIDDNVLHVGCSIGIASYPKDGSRAETLMQKADRAMYEAKLHSLRHFVFYRQETGQQLRRLQQLENEAVEAIEQNQFKIYYQPQVDIQTGQCNRVEALLRWEHPDHGDVMASEFIPILENVGLAREVGHWTIKKVYEQLTDWHDNHHLPISVSVNLSSHQLIQRDFIDYLKSMIGSNESLNHFLSIEITESMLFGDIVTTMEKLQGMDEMGINISLDDFGSGYSSLSQLTQGYVKLLKINRKYIQRIPQDSQAVSLVNSIIAMAHTLDMEVTAVGVENTEQLDHLKTHDCDYAQGFMFSKPLSAEETTEYLLHKK